MQTATLRRLATLSAIVIVSDAGTIIMITGGVIGLMGLFRFMR